MPTQIEAETERLLLEAVGKIPSARVLFLACAGFSSVFSSAFWVGLDSAPNRWTGTQDREYREQHGQRHTEISDTIKSMLERAGTNDVELRECSTRLGFIHENFTDGLSRIRVLETQSHKHHVGK